ncbi:hypothetical protein TNCV_4640451 [Trichonephila clavipes]|nr:hypothetical protein TNCV_4640451 [Trichonephila clavipes]
MKFLKQRMNIKFCVRLGKIAMETCEMLKHMHSRPLSGIDVSRRAGKVSNTTIALDVSRLPATPTTSKSFCGNI